MDSTVEQALQNLLKETASDGEIALIKERLLSGQVSIGGNVSQSVIILGNGNTVQLTSQALDMLNGRSLLGELERDLTGSEIETGLSRLAELLPERAPILKNELDNLSRRVRFTLQTDLRALSSEARNERTEALARLNNLCLEVTEIAFNSLCTGIKPPIYDASSPFRGMEAFRPNDAKYFFARDELTQKLVQKLNEHNFLAVLGASGSGKSSLVMAGLIPLLNIPYAIFRPGTEPLVELEKAIQAKPALLVVDQFEELFTLSMQEQRTDFISHLLEQTKQLQVVLTLRADFLGEVAPFKLLKDEVENHQAIIPPMDEKELLQAMDGQASYAQLRFESDLKEQMLDDVKGEPGAMPLLQFALLELWNRRHGHWLRAKEYRAFGGVKQAIASTAETVYARCTEFERERLRDIFLRLTRLDEGQGGRDTRQRVMLDELIPVGSDPSQTRDLLMRLATSRLVMVEGDIVEVAHEALIRHWPRLQNWLDENRVGLQLRASIRENAIEWGNHGNDSAYLDHRGMRLEEAISLSKQPHLRPNALEQAYLDACIALREKERLERSQRRKWTIAAISAALIVLITILTGWGITSNISANTNATQVSISRTAQAEAQEQTKKAQQQSRFSFARQLANQAASFRSADYQLALLLAIEAVKTTYDADGVATLEAGTVLRGLLSESFRPIILEASNENIKQVVFSPNERYFATLDSSGIAHLWDTTTGKQKLEIQDTGKTIENILFGQDSKELFYTDNIGNIVIYNIEQGINTSTIPNGSPADFIVNRPNSFQIAISSSDGLIRIWDWKKGSLFTTLDIKVPAHNLHFNNDGTEALIYAADGSVMLWRPDENDSLFVLESSKSLVTKVVVDPGWKWTLITRGDGTMVEWDIVSRLPRRTISETNMVQAFYTETGLRYITAQNNGVTSLWDADSHKRIATLTEREVLGMQPYIVKTNDVGNILLIAREEGQADIWEPQNGGQIYTLAGFSGKILSAEISSSGRFIITVHDDKKARLWSAISEPDRLTLHDLPQSAWRVAFDKTGKYIAAAGQDGIAIIWDAASGEIVSKMVGHQLGEGGAAGINNLAFSPTGDKLATAGWDKTARIWDTSSGKSLLVLQHQETVTDVVFSPDGEYLASSDTTGVYLWDVANGNLITKWGTLAAINRLVFDKSGTYLAAAGSIESSTVWNIVTKQKAADLKTYTAMSYIKFSPTGDQLAAVGFGGKAYIWDTKTWTVLADLQGMDDTMWSFAYSPDGSRIVTGGDKGKVRVWDTKTGKLLLSFQAHASRIWSIAYSPKGTFFATGGEDGTIRLWDAQSGASIAILPDLVGAKSVFNFNVGDSNLSKTFNLESGVVSVSSDQKGVTSFSSDKPMALPWVLAIDFDAEGTHIASANMDGAINIYVADVDTLLGIAQTRVDRELTCQERVQFLYENLNCESVATPTP